MKDEMSFTDKFKLIKERYSFIYDLDNDTINKIQNKATDHAKTIELRVYFLMVILAISFFLYFFSVPIYQSDIISNWCKKIVDLINQTNLFNIRNEQSIFLLITYIAVVSYTLVMPNSSKKIPQFLKINYMNIQKTISYYVFTIILNYLALPIPICILIKNIFANKPVSNQIIFAWLFSFLLVILFLLYLLFCILIIVVSMKWLNHDLPTTYDYATIFYLVEIIYLMLDYNNFSSLSPSEKEKLIKLILKISDSIKNMYSENFTDKKISYWSVNQINCAAVNFSLLATWIYFPQENTLENLRLKLCDYLNIFLSGNYHDLPREETEDYQIVNSIVIKDNKLKKIISLGKLCIFLALPVVFYILFVLLFNFKFDSINYYLGILYLIWITAGFIYYAESLTLESKDFIKDIIKTALQRK